jgi:DNA polymerase-3 subunit epsilon
VSTDAVHLDDGALFAIVDVETTGFSPLVGDRIVEIAIIRVAPDGAVLDEYATLVNPQRDVGPYYVHGIMQDDVAAAPIFHEIVGDVLRRLGGVILTAHNLKFDRDFLAAELGRESVFLPALPSMCTLQLSYKLYPSLESHKLEACCECAGVEEAPFHCALEDARSTARLLIAYVREAGADGLGVGDLLEGGRISFPTTWPTLTSTGRVCTRPSRSVGRLDPPYVARLVANLPPIASSQTVAPYLDLLDRALEDRRVTPEEAKAVEATAAAWDLTREQVVGANLNYMEALVVAALEDSVITLTERRDLNDVALLLGIPIGTLDGIISAQAATR